jgi:hypothetical protein
MTQIHRKSVGRSPFASEGHALSTPEGLDNLNVFAVALNHDVPDVDEAADAGKDRSSASSSAWW